MATSRREPPLEEALHRYKLGRCPTCDKGKHASNGLQERKRKREKDLYCHTCERSWQLEYPSVEAFEQELPLVEVEEEVKELQPRRVGIIRAIRKLVSL